MSKHSNQRLKSHYLLRILKEKTDEDTYVTMPEILKSLQAYGVNAERKSIYADIDSLRQLGYDIQKGKGGKPGYSLISRDFELPELKMLVDAVQSAHFITEKKSKQLINRLSELTSKKQAKQLKREVYVADRPRSLNEKVYYAVDEIHRAINDNKMIYFRYFEYDINKKRIFDKGEERYLRLPLTLCWNNDNYYLICYSIKHKGIAHFRVDRMEDVAVAVDVPPEQRQIKKKFDLGDHLKKSFVMFTGQSQKTTLRFDNSLVNVVIDRFGLELPFYQSDDFFDVHVEVYDSPTFLGWMLQFGNKAEIIKPQKMRQKMQELLAETLTCYKG